MLRRYTRYFATLFLAATAMAPANAMQELKSAKPLTFGSVAMDIPAAMHRRLKPLTDYLSEELKQPVTLRISSGLSVASEELASGNVDIAYLTPVAYVKARRLSNVRPVVKTLSFGHDAFQLMIVTQQDSTIKSVGDLKEKTFAFGDSAALLQRAVVVNAGIKLEQLGSYRFLGHYDNVARGVANHDFDAGIIKDTMTTQWTKKGLRIIYTSPYVPPFNISVSSRVSDARFLEIQQALLKLNTSNPRHRAILKALDEEYDGFTKTSDAEYDVIRKLIKPFEK